MTRVQTNSFDAADTVARRVLGEDPYPRIIELLHIEPDDVEASLETLRKYDDQEISFTDAATVHLCESRDIDAVLSFDDDFDRLVDRIEPDAERSGT